MPTNSPGTRKSTPESETGIGRIRNAFLKTEQGQIAALMPYFTLGYPDAKTSMAIIRGISSYSDLLELGMPFSDPIADGPTIQRSTQKAMENGVGTDECLEMLNALRLQGVDTPALLMGYYNPILNYGERKFVGDAKSAGADGLIVPDLPPEEGVGLASECNRNGLALIKFLAPNSSPDRIRVVIESATGFIYVVSITGVTGARKSLPTTLGDFVNNVRNMAKLPVVVGFGISSPLQAAITGSYADGVIVGSALIDTVDKALDKVHAAKEFVSELRMALQVR